MEGEDDSDNKNYHTGLNLAHTLCISKKLGLTNHKCGDLLDYAAQAFICELVNKSMLKPSKKKITENDVLKACNSLGLSDIAEKSLVEFKMPMEEEVTPNKRTKN